MPTVQMNVRIDAKTKAHGDAVFARSGFTPSQVVRAVWEYAGRTGTLPPCMQQDASDQHNECVQRRVRDGFGLAVRLAGTQGFDVASAGNVLQGATWRDLRDDVYDEMLDALGGGADA